MPAWNVIFYVEGPLTMQVEADDESAAIDAAWEAYERGEGCVGEVEAITDPEVSLVKDAYDAATKGGG